MRSISLSNIKPDSSGETVIMTERAGFDMVGCAPAISAYIKRETSCVRMSIYSGAQRATEPETKSMSNGGFNDREKGFEAKYQHDQETQFKITARRNKLLGLWAAEQMGLGGADADAYAKEVVVADFEEAGDDDVLRKVLGDLTDKGVGLDEKAVRKEMDALLATAREQIITEF